jgi:signal transduction histidine kinase
VQPRIGGNVLTNDRLSDVLGEFARNMATDFPIQGILDHLVLRIVDVLPIDAAGVTLISANTDPEYIAFSDESAMRFERLQSELGEGPCLEAFRTNTPISIPDLAQEDRFPDFAERALAEGLVAVFTFPLRHGDRGLGALDLYRESPGPLDESDMAAAQTLADVATAYLLNARSRADLKAASAMEHEALEKLRLLDQSKTEFLATVIHELRTPMTSITGYTEMLQEGDLSGTQKKLLSAVTRNGDRLTALADDLLTLSSLEQPNPCIKSTTVDLRAVVSAVLANFQAHASGRSLELGFTPPDRPVLVDGDVGNLERMVSNLVSNAMKFTDAGGWVRLSLQTSQRHARLEVRDNGIGIPEEEQAHLFTRFFRSSTARANAIPGSGLGLTIVASIVNGHHGTVSVTSARGLGTTIVVELPLQGWDSVAEDA